MTDASLHHCLDDRLVYLPALDPLAFDIPGGARVQSPISVGSIPDFDYRASRDGGCWICAYAEALRNGRVEAPLTLAKVDERGEVDDEVARMRLKVKLRGLTGFAKRALAEAEPDRRRAADAEAPHYREATPAEVRAEDERAALKVRLAGTLKRALQNASLGATPTQAVAMTQNAPIKEDVLEIPPEAVDAVARATRGRKKKGKKFSGEGGGQQSMF